MHFWTFHIPGTGLRSSNLFKTVPENRDFDTSRRYEHF